MFGLRKKKNTAGQADEKPKWQQEIQNLEDDDKILKNLEELPLESLNEAEDDMAQNEQKIDEKVDIKDAKDREQDAQEDNIDDKVKKNEEKVGSNGENQEEEEPEFLGEEEGAQEKYDWMDSEDEDDEKTQKESSSQQKEGNADMKQDAERRTVVVSNLNFELSDKEIRNFFSQFGAIEDFIVPRNDGQLVNKGRAFIQYKTVEQAQLAASKSGEALKHRPVSIILGLPNEVNMTKKIAYIPNKNGKYQSRLLKSRSRSNEKKSKRSPSDSPNNGQRSQYGNNNDRGNRNNYRQRSRSRSGSRERKSHSYNNRPYSKSSNSYDDHRSGQGRSSHYGSTGSHGQQQSGQRYNNSSSYPHGGSSRR